MKEEEKEALKKILEGVENQYAALGLHNHIQVDDTKLIDCRHEIVISLTAKVYEQNDEGQTSNAKEICKKNYHIPVPVDKNYHAYMEGFFTFLENCMSTSAEKAEQKINTGENNE